MINGKPLSMRINPGYDRDPLRPKKHQIVASQDGGKTFTILGDTTEPLELLKIQVEGQHAVGMSETDMMIVDEDKTIVAKYECLHVDPQEGPPTEERLKVRDQWLDGVMKFLLPFRLYEKRNDVDYQPVLKRWFRVKRIAISMRPDGGAVIVYRGGDILTKWGC